ncbi:MAG TPA: QsdR family transcriptional regulator [Candidatus Dormibacteraeota bacterium]|nr:QsdR family transcriptional regulator [Candidatus Dormibacteraeota bacterium]
MYATNAKPVREPEHGASSLPSLAPEPAQTPLEQQLRGRPTASVGPLDAFHAARRHFLHGERVDMGELATELGVNRATLYRWVGSRDQLLGEIMWSMAERGIEQAREEASGTGVEWFMSAYRTFGALTSGSEPLRRFVEREPEAALRVMTSKRSRQQRRVIAAWRDILKEGEREHGLKLRLDPTTLAYVLVRIGESFLWTDLITGEEPDLSKADGVARVLLS